MNFPFDLGDENESNSDREPLDKINQDLHILYGVDNIPELCEGKALNSG